jgi:hypothetical protein
MEGAAWPAGASAWRMAAVGLAVIALGAAGHWAFELHRLPVLPEEVPLFDTVIALALLAYVLAMALPFVPGIELGLALMMMLGDEGVLLVYAATQAALLISFLLGRWVPAHRVGTAFRWLGMERAAALVRRAPGRRGAPAGRYGLGLALLLNLPGNAVIGGAGGIGMMAGMSRAIPLVRYLLIVAAATSPVPLFLLLR